MDLFDIAHASKEVLKHGSDLEEVGIRLLGPWREHVVLGVRIPAADVIFLRPRLESLEPLLDDPGIGHLAPGLQLHDEGGAHILLAFDSDRPSHKLNEGLANA